MGPCQKKCRTNRDKAPNAGSNALRYALENRTGERRPSELQRRDAAGAGIEHSFGARSGARFTKKMFSSCNVRSCSIHATFRAGRERFETSPQNALDVIAAGTVA